MTINVLLIENDKATIEQLSRRIKTKYKFEVKTAQNLKKAWQLVGKTHFNLIISDLRLPNLIINPGKKNEINLSSIEFLKYCEQQFPRTRLAISSAADVKEQLKGLHFFKKIRDTRELFKFIAALKDHPLKKPHKEEIDLRQYKGILHVVSGTRKMEALKLIRTAAESSEKIVHLLRRGYGGTSRQEMILRLEKHAKSHHVQKPLSGSIFDMHDRHIKRAIGHLKKFRKTRK